MPIQVLRTAAKLIGEIAGIGRFASDAKLARLAGSAPIPASSGRTHRHRLDRGGNRQLNCALHRLAISKGRLDPDSAAYIARKQAEGKAAEKRCAASSATSPDASGDSYSPRPPSTPTAHQHAHRRSCPPASRSTATHPTAASP